MKRIALVLLTAIIAVGAVSAQGMWAPPAATEAQTLVKIEGKLALVQGHPAVVVKDKTYFVRIPAMLYGFVAELKEGATVKLEGYEQAVPLATGSYFFQVLKLTVGGKDYDLSQMGARGGMMGQMGNYGGMMGGRGGRGARGGRW